METPKSITLHDGAFAFDGGSIVLYFRDENGRERTLYLPQHSLPANFEPSHHPGRLYLDGVAVPVREQQETELLLALRVAVCAPTHDEPFTGQMAGIGEDIVAYIAALKRGPKSVLEHLLREVIKVVESEDYVERARRQSS